MSETKYGVLIGKVKKIDADVVEEKTPHYKIVVEASEDNRFNVAINCESSNDKNPRVLYYADENCQLDLFNILKNMDNGFHEVDYANNINSNLAIDYIREDLFNPDEMKLLPYDIAGDNDLKGYIDKNMKKALNNDRVNIYLFGTYYDGYDGRGIHNIHMNQGNRGKHYGENKIYHDGCFFIYFTEEDNWTAYYLAFQNQSWKTDERGNPKD